MPVILVVDDDPSILKLLDVELESLGEVVCFDSGDAALEWTAENLPDVVVLDVTMPGTSGLDVVRAWREDERTAALEVILLSGLDAPKDQAAGYRAGADAYVTKPLNIELLEPLVAAMLDISRTKRQLLHGEMGREPRDSGSAPPTGAHQS